MNDQPPAPEPKEPAGNAEPEDGVSKSVIDRIPPSAAGLTVLILAVAFTFGFIWLTKETFDAADGDDPGWSRKLYVFQSLFAIVTAIVGAVFSATIYRPQLKKAAIERRQAEGRAEKNARQAGGVREHGERRAAETRERILEEALKRKRSARVVQPEEIEDSNLRASFIREFQKGEDVGYMPRSGADEPPDVLTIDDLAAAIDATRSSDPSSGSSP